MLKLSPKYKSACSYIFESAKRLGGNAYFVGGCVRDALLGVESKDLDIEIYGIPPQELEKMLRANFRVEMVGKSFGVWILKGYDIDVSIPRKERKTGEGHKAFDIESDPFLPIDQACARRDFTINAILYDHLEDKIIDPYNGVEDLRNGIIRHTSPRFSEDPLRVLRAMQFSARFDMQVAPETVELCSQIPFENLPIERVFEEWKKLLLKGKKISRGLNFLRDCGWIKYFPELNATVGCEQDSQWHPEGDVFTHTGFCLDAYASARTGDAREDLIVGLAVLCHDFGKPRCTTLGDDGKIHSHGHDILGVVPTQKFLARLTREKSIIDEVVPLVERHMAILDLWRVQAGDSAIRRLARKVGRIDRLVRVDFADRNGRGENYFEDDSPQGQWIIERATALAVQDSAPKPIIMGRHLQSIGMEPSREFGKILASLYEEQLDGVFSDVEGGMDRLHKMLEK